MHLVRFVYLSIISLATILLIGCVLSLSAENTQKASAECTNDLSGIWNGNDGGTYFVKQNGREVWWAGGNSFSVGSDFTNVFDGTRDGTVIKGLWADVPIGNTRGNGELSLQCNQDANNDILTKTSESGGFGGNEWLKPKDVMKKTTFWNNWNRGDCHLVTAYINLFSNGNGVWHADVISDSDDDSWVVQKLTIVDTNGNTLFTVPKFSSPTLQGGPVPFATGPGPEEDKNRVWNNENIQFPVEIFNSIGNVNMDASC